MNWMRLINPTSSILMALKVVAGGAFLLLGVLFMLDGTRLYEGIVLVGISAAWLFFVLRNYRKQRIDLESLR